MGIGTLRRHWESSEDEGEVTTASDLAPSGEVQEDGTENTGEGQEKSDGDDTSTEDTGNTAENTDKDSTEGEGAENAPQPPTRSASKKDWVAFYEATGQTIPEDVTRDSLAEAVLGPKE